MENSLLHFFFYLFSSLALLSAFLVVMSSNAIYSAPSLVLVFINAAALVLLLDLEFLSMIFAIVYVGAIMVLFLFIITMLDIKRFTAYLDGRYYSLISGLILTFLAVKFFGTLSQDLGFISHNTVSQINWFSLVGGSSSLEALGMYLYTDYAFLLILVSLLLLVAMVGAISLAAHVGETRNMQFQHIQLNTGPKQSLFYVK